MTQPVANGRFTKRALRREEGYPVGISAPLYVACGCGEKVPVPTIKGLPMTYKCGQCGIEYDQAGWILSEPDSDVEMSRR